MLNLQACRQTSKCFFLWVQVLALTTASATGVPAAAGALLARPQNIPNGALQYSSQAVSWSLRKQFIYARIALLRWSWSSSSSL